MKNDKHLMGAGFLAAIGASLCCITPVLALIAGTSGIASTFSWLEPLRPYLIGLTILALGFAWYQKLNSLKATEPNCACDDDKPSIWQSRKFLGVVTIFTVALLAFPLYAEIFYPKTAQQKTVTQDAAIRTIEFKIKGMTCNGCAEHVNHEVNKLDGIISTKASYEEGNAIIQFDTLKTKPVEIEQSINSTGYSVTDRIEK